MNQKKIQIALENLQIKPNKKTITYSVKISGKVIEQLSFQLGVSIEDACAIYHIMGNIIRENIVQGKAVGIPGFGCIYSGYRRRKMRALRDGKTGLYVSGSVSKILPDIRLKLDAPVKSEFHKSAFDHGTLRDQVKKEFKRYTKAHYGKHFPVERKKDER